VGGGGTKSGQLDFEGKIRTTWEVFSNSPEGGGKKKKKSLVVPKRVIILSGKAHRVEWVEDLSSSLKVGRGGGICLEEASSIHSLRGPS